MSKLQGDYKKWRSDMAYSVYQDKYTGVKDCECNKVTFAHSVTATNQGREGLSTNIKASTCGPSGTTSAEGRSRRMRMEV